MTKKQKIAFVSDSIYPYNTGGKETRLFEISTRLARRGYDVHIYCMKWWSTKPTIKIEHGVTLHGISPYFPLYKGDKRSIKQGVLFGLFCIKLLFEQLDIVEVDHMPFFPIYTMKLVCLLKRKKLFATWHEVWGRKYWIKYMGWKGIISSLIEFISFYLPDTIFVSSPLTQDRLKAYLPQNKIIFIRNGINIEQISSAKPSKYTSDIIYAGRLLKHKHVDILVEAIKKVSVKKKKLKAIIIGNGPERKSVVRLIQSLHLSSVITFIDFVKETTELYGLMKSSKVFVLPSDREGFGLVVIEALACGIPVITVDEKDNASKMLLTEKTGIVTQLYPEALSRSIETLLDKKMFINTSLIKRDYNWDVIIQDYEKAYSI